MNFDVPQAEKFWRDKIAREVSMFIIGENFDTMTTEEMDLVSRIIKSIKRDYT